MRIVHPIAGILAFLIISIFWISTAVTELFGTTASVIWVKSAIPWGFLLLIPALALTGATGFAQAKGRQGRLVAIKKKRMPFIAANGLLILIPCALYLYSAAQTGSFNSMFYGVQTLELIAGGINIFLLGLNMRDGLRMTGRLRHQQAKT